MNESKTISAPRLLSQLQILLYADLPAIHGIKAGDDVNALRRLVMQHKLSPEASSALMHITDDLCEFEAHSPREMQEKRRQQLIQALELWVRVWYLFSVMPKDHEKELGGCNRDIWARAVVPAWEAFEVMMADHRFYNRLVKLSKNLGRDNQPWRKGIILLNAARGAYSEWKERATSARLRRTASLQTGSAYNYWSIFLGDLHR
jgi:hypothetical protein